MAQDFLLDFLLENPSTMEEILHANWECSAEDQQWESFKSCMKSKEMVLKTIWHL